MLTASYQQLRFPSYLSMEVSRYCTSSWPSIGASCTTSITPTSVSFYLALKSNYNVFADSPYSGGPELHNSNSDLPRGRDVDDMGLLRYVPA